MASKVQERIYVEAFLRGIGCQHAIIEERESPDFLISENGQRFGLEVSQVFRDQALVDDSGSAVKAVESRRSRFLCQLAADYYSAGGLPLNVHALITNPVASKDAGLVHQLIRARPAIPWERIRVEIDGASLHLRALPPEAGHYTRWVAVDNSVGWHGLIGPEHILPVIQKKSACLARYRSIATRIELLLVIDTTRWSGMVRWDPASAHPSAHGFDALYLYFHPKGAVRIA
jgi:hypothetical protein